MKTYEDGLNDAWEVARKIGSADGYSCGELSDIFGSRSVGYVFDYLTASEAIDAIEKYERLKVGSEVVDDIGNIAIVTRIIGDEVCVVYSDGITGISKKKDFKMTGRSFPQIEEVLKQMKERE